MTEINEKEIIGCVLDGDTEAFSELVTRYEKTVYNLALRMVGDRSDAADMAQEAFVKAWTNLPSYRGESRFSAWLYRITTNVCLDFLRHKSRRPQVSLSTSDDDEERQLDIPDHKSMPEELLMKKLGMEAPQLSLEEGTVKSRIFRARKNLCAFLLGDGNIPDSIASNDREEAD